MTDDVCSHGVQRALCVWCRIDAKNAEIESLSAALATRAEEIEKLSAELSESAGEMIDAATTIFRQRIEIMSLEADLVFLAATRGHLCERQVCYYSGPHYVHDGTPASILVAVRSARTEEEPQ